MRVYNYDPKTKEFTGTATADPNPLEEGAWLIPGHSTTKPMTHTLKANEAPVFVDGKWKVKADFRGVTYWNKDGARTTIASIGHTPPSDARHDDPALDKPLEVMKQEAVAQVVGFADSLTARVTSEYPVAERDAWMQKYLEAQAILGADEGERDKALEATQILRVLAAGAGWDTPTLLGVCAKIVEKAGTFNQLSATVELMRYQAAEALGACTEASQLAVVLAGLHRGALETAAQMGITLEDGQ